MTFPERNDQSERTASALAKLNPKHWTRKTKLIAVGAVLALVLAGVGGGFAYHRYTIDRDCIAQSKLFTTQKSDLTTTVKAAYDALHSVDASLKVGEGDRLAHTNDFPTSTEGQEAINTLNKVLNKAEKHNKDTAPEQCSGTATLASFKTLTGARQTDLDALKAQTAAFITTRDAYRLTKATDEANELMDTAKSNLASAQQSAAEQIAAVEADPNMESDASVKAAYDALKAVETESHTLSTTVTVTTYDEAVASIEKAKTVEQKAAEVTASVAPLQEAITTYQDAKAGSAPNASTTPEQGASTGNSNAPAPSYGYNGNGGSSNSGSNGSSYSGGSSYTPPAPAPAPAPAPPANNSGSGDGRIDFGPGQADRPGCVIIEGRTVC